MTAETPSPTWSVERTDGALPAPVLAKLRDLADASAEADGNPPLSEQTLVTLRSEDARGSVTVFSARSAAGSDGAAQDAELAGVAVVVRGTEDGAVLELVVAPDTRAKGVGTALVEAVLAGGFHGLKGWSHGNHAAAADLAARFGFVPVR